MRVVFLNHPEYLTKPVFGPIFENLDSKDIVYNIDENTKDSVNRINAILKKKHRVLYLPKLIKETRELKKTINTLFYYMEPEIFLAQSDLGDIVNRMCNEWAVRHRIPFCLMQTAFLEGGVITRKRAIKNYIKYLILNKILRTSLASRQLTWGMEYKSNYIFAWGDSFVKKIKWKDICYSGNPQFDEYAKPMTKVYVGKPKVLVCMEQYEELVESGYFTKETEDKLYKMFTDMAETNPNIHFIFRVHPVDSIDKYEAMFKKVKTDNWEVVKTKETITEMLKEVDVQVSVSSYSSFQAIVQGVPVILVHQYLFPNNHHYDNAPVLRADNIGEFYLRLNDCLQPWYRKAFINGRAIYLADKLDYFGNSTRHVGLLMRLICQN